MTCILAVRGRAKQQSDRPTARVWLLQIQLSKCFDLTVKSRCSRTSDDYLVSKTLIG